MNQLNNSTDDKKENELNLPNYKYRDTDFFIYFILANYWIKC